MLNPYFVAVGIPLILILCGALARKLVRGTAWVKSDFFLGVQLSLAAMASALVYLFDLSKLTTIRSTAASIPTKLAATGGFLTLCFFLLLWILSTHQDWEKRPQSPTGQVIWLGIFSNLVGASLLATFVLLIKGV